MWGDKGIMSDILFVLIIIMVMLFICSVNGCEIKHDVAKIKRMMAKEIKK